MPSMSISGMISTKSTEAIEPRSATVVISSSTGNPIESTFATVRHRTVRSKGCLSYETAKFMVFKTIQAALKSWRELDGQNQLPKFIKGIKFTGGIETAPDHAAA